MKASPFHRGRKRQAQKIIKKIVASKALTSPLHIVNNGKCFPAWLWKCFLYNCKLSLTFYLQVPWSTPTDVQALWKGLTNILRQILTLEIKLCVSKIAEEHSQWFQFQVFGEEFWANCIIDVSHRFQPIVFYVNCHKNKRSIICVANNAAEYK